MSEIIDVGPESEFAKEDAGTRIYGEKFGLDYDIAIINDAGLLYAIDNECTHAIASLADGWVENGCVECPLHASEFSLTTGEALSLPATKPVRTHKLEIVDGRVLVYPDEPRPRD